jgi:hypothetical protein
VCNKVENNAIKCNCIAHFLAKNGAVMTNRKSLKTLLYGTKNGPMHEKISFFKMDVTISSSLCMDPNERLLWALRREGKMIDDRTCFLPLLLAQHQGYPTLL